jgi:hypothetical protein
MTVQASSGQTWRCVAVPSGRCKDERDHATRGLVLLELDERDPDTNQCMLVSQFLKLFPNNLPKGLQSIPQRIQERVGSPQVSFSRAEANKIVRVRTEEKYNPALGQMGRVHVEEEYKSAIAHLLAHSKDREKDLFAGRPQASLPSAEVNEIGRVLMEEENNAAIERPLAVEMIV